MGRVTFDLDVLRSFVVGLELGSFAKAADRLGRSTSAISAQLKKLEEQAGAPILHKSGRGLVPTPAGEVLLGYARRLLELNDEAVTAVRGTDLAGVVRIGLQEDFGEGLLTGILGNFSRAHPAVRIEARVARNAELLEAIATARLDLALVWDSGHARAYGESLEMVPMQWIGDAGLAAERLANGEPLPLVMFEPPCLMRSCAIEALDRAGIPWRMAFTGSSLSGIWAAVGAGLGVTVRTPVGRPANVQAIDKLPALPEVGLRLCYRESEPTPVLQRLSKIIRERLADPSA